MCLYEQKLNHQMKPRFALQKYSWNESKLINQFQWSQLYWSVFIRRDTASADASDFGLGEFQIYAPFLWTTLYWLSFKTEVFCFCLRNEGYFHLSKCLCLLKYLGTSKCLLLFGIKTFIITDIKFILIKKVFGPLFLRFWDLKIYWLWFWKHLPSLIWTIIPKVFGPLFSPFWDFKIYSWLTLNLKTFCHWSEICFWTINVSALYLFIINIESVMCLSLNVWNVSFYERERENGKKNGCIVWTRTSGVLSKPFIFFGWGGGGGQKGGVNPATNMREKKHRGEHNYLNYIIWEQLPKPPTHAQVWIIVQKSIGKSDDCRTEKTKEEERMWEQSGAEF